MLNSAPRCKGRLRLKFGINQPDLSARSCSGNARLRYRFSTFSGIHPLMSRLSPQATR